MTSPKRHIPEIPFIRRLCGHLPDDEIRAAEERFVRYLEVTVKAFERSWDELNMRNEDLTHE